jgi:hypothetical protein
MPEWKLTSTMGTASKASNCQAQSLFNGHLFVYFEKYPLISGIHKDEDKL